MTLTKKREILNCPLGLYRVTWTTGGQSLACIGNDPYGNRWIACANWLGSAPLETTVDEIELLDLIEGSDQ